jgi:hypothetical protein
MRVTLIGVLGFVALATLLVYAGYELYRVSLEMRERKAKPNPQSERYE